MNVIQTKFFLSDQFRDLKAADSKVLLYLSASTRPAGTHVSVSKMTGRTGLSRNTVMSALNRLEVSELINVQRENRKTSRISINPEILLDNPLVQKLDRPDNTELQAGAKIGPDELQTGAKIEPDAPKLAQKLDRNSNTDSNNNAVSNTPIPPRGAEVTEGQPGNQGNQGNPDASTGADEQAVTPVSHAKPTTTSETRSDSRSGAGAKRKSPRKTKKQKDLDALSELPLPSGLPPEAWASWCEFRVELGCYPLASAKAQLAELAVMPEPAAAINSSIAAGYKKIYPAAGTKKKAERYVETPDKPKDYTAGW